MWGRRRARLRTNPPPSPSLPGRGAKCGFPHKTKANTPARSSELLSYEPATGAILGRGQIGDVDAEVAAARESWAPWAAHPLAYRIEALRRFANVVRARADDLADLLARETGKPLW